MAPLILRCLLCLTFIRQYDASILCLAKLQILSNIHTIPAKLNLNSHFRSSFRMALTGAGNHMSFGVPSTKDKDKEGDKKSIMTVEQLDGHAAERWEVRSLDPMPKNSHQISPLKTILHYMVSSGSGNVSQKPSSGVLLLLQRSGLMSNIK